MEIDSILYCENFKYTQKNSKISSKHSKMEQIRKKKNAKTELLKL